MGYYTTFSLLNNLSENEMKALQEIQPDYFESESYIDELTDGCFNAKWYDWEKDMLNLSSRFPDTLYTLYGVGESGYDLWVAYFQNGKMQYEQAEILYGEFDPTKLK